MSSIMKSIPILFLLLFTTVGLTQELTLPKVNFKLIQKEYENSGYSEELIYLYLSNTFDSLDIKRDTVFYNYPDYSICSFSQDFEYGIRYNIEQCKEAGGVSVVVVLPQSEQSSIIDLIETLYKVDRTEIENEWNKEKSKYRPRDEGVGCYYEIIDQENSTVIKNYCGC